MYEKKGDPDFTINFKMNQKKKRKKKSKNKSEKKCTTEENKVAEQNKNNMDVSIMVIPSDVATRDMWANRDRVPHHRPLQIKCFFQLGVSGDGHDKKLMLE